nr:CBS domain-containing protein [Saprospiraceae bacterium]
LQECMDLVIRNGLANYLVMDLEGNYCGTVSTYKIVKLQKENPALRIKDIYHPQLTYMKPSTPLMEAMQTIRGGQPVILIEEEEGGLSYIDGEVIERYMMLEGRA